MRLELLLVISLNLTEQQKSDILNEIYEAFHIYMGFHRNLFASSICICESCRELDDHEEFN
jgi:hypothetical protein